MQTEKPRNHLPRDPCIHHSIRFEVIYRHIEQSLHKEDRIDPRGNRVLDWRCIQPSQIHKLKCYVVQAGK